MTSTGRTLLVIMAALPWAPALALAVEPVLVEVEGRSAVAVSVETTATAGANGETNHEITATFVLGGATQLFAHLASRIAGTGASSDGFAMTISYLTADGHVSQRTDAGGVTVTGIDLPGYDATARSPVQIVVRMRATRLRTLPGDGAVTSSIGPRRLTLLRSNFRAGLDVVSSTRVERVAPFALIPCAQRMCDSISRVEIVVPASESKAWREWFDKRMKDPGLMSSGAIEQLSTDLKEVVMTFRLYDVRPVSYSDLTTSTGAKARIVMSARVEVK